MTKEVWIDFIKKNGCTIIHKVPVDFFKKYSIEIGNHDHPHNHLLGKSSYQKIWKLNTQEGEDFLKGSELHFDEFTELYRRSYLKFLDTRDNKLYIFTEEGNLAFNSPLFYQDYTHYRVDDRPYLLAGRDRDDNEIIYSVEGFRFHDKIEIEHISDLVRKVQSDHLAGLVKGTYWTLRNFMDGPNFSAEERIDVQDAFHSAAHGFIERHYDDKTMLEKELGKMLTSLEHRVRQNPVELLGMRWAA